MKRLIPLLFLSLAGCPALTASVPDAWVKADRARKNAVAPEYLQYVDADANLDEQQKQRRHNTIDAWEMDLAQHEQSLKGGK
jgi:hypothetical protein